MDLNEPNQSICLAAMNIFQTHAGIMADDATYIRSSLNIAESTIREQVKGELRQGQLWPDPRTFYARSRLPTVPHGEGSGVIWAYPTSIQL